MENLLREIWPFVENVGIPILAIIGGLSFFSINFYWSACRHLRKLEEHIRNNNSTKGFKEHSFPTVGLFDIIYGFKPISKFDTNFLKYKSFNEQLSVIKAYRKFYIIVFPIVISLAIIGITINEMIIDK